MLDSAFCSGVLIKAFVWQVSASDDEVLVTPNHDIERRTRQTLTSSGFEENANGAPRQGSNLWPSAPEADALSNWSY